MDKLQAIRGIAFDLDGTLVDSCLLYTSRQRHALPASAEGSLEPGAAGGSG